MALRVIPPTKPPILLQETPATVCTSEEEMSLLAAQCVTVWLCLQLPLGMILGRYIASADVIAK
jgi:hypothetical protein